jgi:hypothetical protein
MLLNLLDQNGIIDPHPQMAHNYCNAWCELCKKRPDCKVAINMECLENLEKAREEDPESLSFEDQCNDDDMIVEELDEETGEWRELQQWEMQQQENSWEAFEYEQEELRREQDPLYQGLFAFSSKIRKLHVKYAQKETILEWQMLMNHSCMLPARLRGATSHEIPEHIVGKYPESPEFTEQDEDELYHNQPEQAVQYWNMEDSFLRLQVLLNALDICRTVLRSLTQKKRFPQKHASTLITELNQQVFNRFAISRRYDMWWKTDLMKMYRELKTQK